MAKLIETPKEKKERMEDILNDHYGSQFIEHLELSSRLMKRYDPDSNPDRDYLMMLAGAFHAWKQNR